MRLGGATELGIAPLEAAVSALPTGLGLTVPDTMRPMCPPERFATRRVHRFGPRIGVRAGLRGTAKPHYRRSLRRIQGGDARLRSSERPPSTPATPEARTVRVGEATEIWRPPRQPSPRL